MDYLAVRNWGTFQHYKDRNPPWIKLHTSILDDYEFQHLPDGAKWQLLLLWALAARKDNRIPYDRVWIASTIGVLHPDTGSVDVGGLEIELLVEGGWLEVRPSTKREETPGPGREKRGVGEVLSNVVDR